MPSVSDSPGNTPPEQPGSTKTAVRQLASQRWRIAIAMTAVMMAVYFGFILLVAFAPNWLGQTVTPGLSFGIALGVVVIFTAWLLTLLYVR